MEQKNFTIQSNFDGLTLHATVYEPKGEKKGVFQILHGMCEYKERYAPLMRFFCENGYVAVCHDQRGHGDSVKSPEDWGYFYEYSANAIVEDAAQMTREIKKLYPNLPIVLFGHSMGSMVARCYLRKHDDMVDKAVVCGSPSANPFAGVAIFLTKVIRLFRGDHYRSKLLTYLSTGKGNERFNEGKGAWLSKNRANIDEFYANPKGDYRFTTNGFENLFKLMKRTYTKKGYEVKKPDLPIYFVSGSDDAVLGGEKNWEKTLAFMRKVGYKNVTGTLYQGLRHEVHNELDNENVLADLLAFAKGEK